MPYIGNTIRAADDYRLIDDISSGFNGSTTSFALQVAGSAPVPFPKSPQQVLISVNGVIQEPDPTGASGFNLVGTNIVFSSAPTNGHAFFGIIYATADYLNAGGNFPAGSLGAPSITFIGDENTGLFRKGSGSVGFVSDATEIANFDSNGITISSGNLIIPGDIIHSGDTNTKIRFSDTDQIKLETGSVQKLRLDNTEVVVNDDGADVDFRVEGDTDTNLIRVDAATDHVGIGTPAARSKFEVFDSSVSAAFNATDLSTWRVLQVRNNIESNTGTAAGIALGGDGSSDTETAGICGISGNNTGGVVDLAFLTAAGNASTERMRILSGGNVGIGITNPANTLHLDSSSGAVIQLQRTSSNASNRLLISHDGTDGTIESSNDLLFRNNGAERMRITSAGRVGIGTTSLGSHQLISEGGKAETGGSCLALKTSGGANSITSALALYGTFVSPTSDQATRRTADIVSGFSTNNWGNEFLAFHVGKGGSANDAQAVTDERMRIDGSGRMLIATTSASEASTNADDLVIGNSSSGTQHGITIATGSSSVGNIRFADNGDDTAGAVTYNHSTERLLFYANSGLRVTVDSDGLKFGSDTAAANALDDYEEGTWTATLGPASNEFTPTSNTNTCTYTKIGRQVTVVGIAKMTTPSSLNSYTNDSINHALSVSGLPFNIANAINGRSAATLGVGGDIQFPNGVLATHGNDNNASFAVFVNKSNGGTRTSPTLATNTAMNFHFSFTYFI